MAAIKRWDPKEVRSLYDFLKDVDQKEWDRDPETLGKELATGLSRGEAKKAKDSIHKLGAMGKLMARVAKTASFEEFHHAMETGDLPPIKLTPQEMEVIRGGCGPLVVPLVSMGISAIGGIAKSKAAKGAAVQQFNAARDQFNAQYDLQVAQGQAPDDPGLRAKFLTANGVGDSANPNA